MWPEADGLLAHVTAPRPALPGLMADRPAIMGVLNVTPDSFSDGGLHDRAGRAVARGMEMVAEGADIIDIGGESTRPGAKPVPEAEELSRVLSVVDGLRMAGCPVPISIDTRNAAVAKAAIDAGAQIFNDVSALSHDPESVIVAGAAGAVCLMHAQGDPRTMHLNPSYENVLLDVYDHLAARIAAAEAAGIARQRLIIDPGIGFGKTLTHNVTLIRGLALFLTLGCPVLLGVSRKRFIGTLSGEETAARRAPGSIAAGLAGLDQGAAILRVHDVDETVQAVRVWQAIRNDNADNGA